MRHWLVIGLFVLSSCLAAPQKQKDKLQNSSYSLQLTEQGAWSVYAVDLTSGKPILSEQANQRMTPASLTKILTTGAALQQLGTDFKYETNFYIQPDGKDNHLLVVGSGDPTLGSDRFEKTKPKVLFGNLLAALQQKEITAIENLVVDNFCYDGIPYPSKRLWEDMGNYYGAVPNGLSYRENTFYLTLQSPEGVGKPVKIVKTEPALNVRINCKVKTAANQKDSAYIYGNELMDEWYVSGTIPQGRPSFIIKGALPNPEKVFASELKRFLKKNGVEVGKIEYKKVSVYDGTQLLYRHTSPALEQIAAVTNKRSHNLFADHLLFTMAMQDEAVNWDAGVRHLAAFWKEKIPGFSATLFDGSGLSPFNAFSAKDMVELLAWMNISNQHEAFENSLSVAGIDGTLKSIFKEEEYKGRLIGKSGSMNGVLTYCGYLTTRSGNKVAFCIMANRFTESYTVLRSNMETLMKEIVDQN